MKSIHLTGEILSTIYDALGARETDIDDGMKYGDYTSDEGEEALKKIAEARAALDELSDAMNEADANNYDSLISAQELASDEAAAAREEYAAESYDAHSGSEARI